MIQMTVKIDLDGLKRALSNISPEQMAPVFRNWGRVYSSFLYERFDKFSKGGGDWKPLAESTIMARRHGMGGRYKRGRKAYNKAKASGGGQVSILRDTGILLNALDPTMKAPGNRREVTRDGIIVGFGGKDKHPGTDLTIVKLAEYHQTGGGRLPARPIIVEPDTKTMQKLREILILKIRSSLKCQ